MNVKRILLAMLILVMIFIPLGCSSPEEAAEPAEPTEEQEPTETEPATNGVDYPTDTITVLQGFNPGGGSDALAQITQPYLEEILGVNLVNDYMPGAAGGVAWSAFSRMDPDGYMLSITNTPMISSNYIIHEELAYSIDDLDPIANVVTDPNMILVSADSPFETIEDVFEHAAQNPGDVTMGNSGIGGDEHIATVLLEQQTGLEFEHVPFEGSGPNWQAALGGHIDLTMNNLGITFELIEDGELRPLLIFTEERSHMVPDVPTFNELDDSYDLTHGSSRGYSAPAGLDEAKKEILIDAFRQMAENEDFLQGAAERALEVNMLYGDEYRALLEQDEQNMRDIWDAIDEEEREDIT